MSKPEEETFLKTGSHYIVSLEFLFTNPILNEKVGHQVEGGGGGGQSHSRKLLSFLVFRKKQQQVAESSNILSGNY